MGGAGVEDDRMARLRRREHATVHGAVAPGTASALPSRGRAAARLASTIGALALLIASNASGAPISWRTQEMSSSVRNLPLGDVLRDLASSEDLRVSVDPSLRGRVSLDFRGPPTALLSRLEASHGVQWYYDGSVLYFTSAEQHTSAVLRMPGQISTKSFEATLTRLGIADTRFPLRADPVERLLIVSGPPRYVELVREAARANGVQRPSDEEEVRVFPLRYGSAKDRTVQVGEESTTVPGIATLMNTVLNGVGDHAAAPSGASPAPSARAGATGTEPSRAHRRNAPGGAIDVPAPMYEDYERMLGRFSTMGATRSGSGLPQIHADPRLNAVIVRDLARRMDSHERFIRALDVRPRMIELHLRIIDTETVVSQGRNLEATRGVASEASASGNMRRSPADVSGAAAWRRDSPYTEIAAGALPYTSVVQTPVAHSLPVQQQGDGRARLVAEPRLMALDNVVAEFGNTKTFYARGDGGADETGGALRIDAGTRVRVLPKVIVEADGTRRIHLSVTLHDGGMSGRTGDELPMTSAHTLNTNAIVRSGESLLIGGLTYDYERGTASSRAGLRPSHTARTERMYLITPRLVEE